MEMPTIPVHGGLFFSQKLAQKLCEELQQEQWRQLQVKEEYYTQYFVVKALTHHTLGVVAYIVTEKD